MLGPWGIQQCAFLGFFRISGIVFLKFRRCFDESGKLACELVQRCSEASGFQTKDESVRNDFCNNGSDGTVVDHQQPLLASELCQSHTDLLSSAAFI